MQRHIITPLLLPSLLSGIVAFAACGGKDPMSTESATTDNPSEATTDEETATTTAGVDPTTTTDATTTTTGGTDTDGMTGGTTDGGCQFIDCADGGPGGGNECDIWAQDCPDGEKCMPFANDGSNAWNATKCSQIDPNASLIGDECQGGGVTGEDNCELGSMCYYVDSETGLGVCIPFCIGSENSPMCANITEQCSVSNSGVLILCRPICNPLIQDCQGSAACLPAAGSDAFVCIVDASGESGQSGDPCEYLNSCNPGLLCAGASFVPNCVANGCCTEFCDLQDPNADDTCALKDSGVSCQAYYEPGTEPPGLENVGVCILPP